MQVRAEILLEWEGAVVRPPAGKVVPFLRPGAAATGRTAPVVAIESDARPAPMPAARFVRAKWALFMAGSLALHAGVFAAFHREAPPLASVGEQSISVEIVLGTDRLAGISLKKTEAEATVDATAAQGEGPDLVKPETAREAKMAESVPTVTAEHTPRPVEAQRDNPTQRAVAESPNAAETAVAEAKTARTAVAASEIAEPEPVERADAPPAAPLLATTAPSEMAAPPMAQPEQPVAETATVVAALPETVEVPRPRPERPQAAEKPPEVRAAEPPRKRRPVAQKKKDRGEDARTRESANSVASRASSGIGRGRSDTSSNYRGIVAAQLARNKHFPPDAMRNGQEGRAVVSFTIDGGGRVSRVALVRGTGVASLDREAQAMVNRAAPFPPPPSQRSMRFTVPVSFDLR